jgi:hypothetical protein
MEAGKLGEAEGKGKRRREKVRRKKKEDCWMVSHSLCLL